MAFEKKPKEFTSVDFTGTINHLLGIKFAWKCHEDGKLYAHMYLIKFSENLIYMVGLYRYTTSVKVKSLRNGHSIDSVSHIHITSA